MQWPSYTPTLSTLAPKPSTSKPHSRTRKPARPWSDDGYIPRPSYDDDDVFTGIDKSGKKSKNKKGGKGTRRSKRDSKTAKDNKETKSRKEKPSRSSKKGANDARKDSKATNAHATKGEKRLFRSALKWKKMNNQEMKTNKELI